MVSDQISDKSIEFITENFPQLIALNVMGCTQISWETLYSLVQSKKDLRLLAVSPSDSITKENIVDSIEDFPSNFMLLFYNGLIESLRENRPYKLDRQNEELIKDILEESIIHAQLHKAKIFALINRKKMIASPDRIGLFPGFTSYYNPDSTID